MFEGFLEVAAPILQSFLVSFASSDYKDQLSANPFPTHVHRRLEGGILSGYGILDEPLSLFLVQATIIIGTCRALALLGTYLRQPKVIFEIIGGVILGPSAIGRNEHYLELIFPHSSLGYLSIVANIGLTFYLFLVGLELDPKLLMTHARKAGLISFCGVCFPFCIGIAISRVMFDTLEANDPEFKDVDFVAFFVFIGTAMSITAFPVLARILKEGGLIYTRAGALTMGAAAIDDATAWCLLTLSISIANAGNIAVAGYVFATVVGFALVLLFIVKPILERFVDYIESMHNANMNNNLFALTIMLLFMCAWTTALLGVHAIFGAFLFGLTIPRGSHLFKECNERIEEFVLTFTLPLYFTLSGLKTDVTTIRTGVEGGITVLVCFCATAGKFLGAGGAALVGGMSLRESSVVAVLMNTRGLVELIVLNLGIQSHILNIRTFSVMVIMCLFTTFMTSPVISLVYPVHMRVRAVEEKLNEKKLDIETGAGEGKEGESGYSGNGYYADYSRIAVVVDMVGHLQRVVNAVSFFLPQVTGSELAVTALHFIEPTLSKQDEFLPLNEEGKLIRIDEESTDFMTALQNSHDPAAKPPELLPLSVFCRASHAAVNAFRVQGDPEEFPEVLQNLTRSNDCSLVLFPWRPKSLYVQKLFWQSVNTANSPVALLLTFESFRNPFSEVIESHSGRSRSNTIEGTGSSGRARGNSMFQHFNSALPTEETAATPHLYTTLPANILPQHRRTSITQKMNKVSGISRNVSKIAVLITSQSLDYTALALAKRFSDNPLTQVYLLLPPTIDNDPSNPLSADITQAIDLFVSEMTALNRMVITQKLLASPRDDGRLVVDEILALEADLLITSVLPPSDDSISLEMSMDGHSTTRRGSNAGQVEGNSGRGRSQSIGGALAEALMASKLLNADAPGTVEERLQCGMPEMYAASGWEYPELGQLGVHLANVSITREWQMLVLHETRTASRLRLNSSEHTSIKQQHQQQQQNQPQEAEEEAVFEIEMPNT